MNNLISLLQPFGLTDEESEIYLYLLQHGTKSALDISRGIHKGRTKIYRLVELLKQKGLVTEKYDDLGFKFIANDYRQLEMLLKQKETDLDTLKQTLPAVYQQMAGVIASGGEKSRVLYYHGNAGLTQITWNSLNADKGGLRIFEVASSMDPFVDRKMSEKIRTEFAKRQIMIYQLTNLTHIEPYTKVADLMKYWELRYIDPKQISIQFEYLIYNDVYATYNSTDQEKFGVEIYNDKLASTQKKLFDFVWNSARKMKIISDQGEAILA